MVALSKVLPKIAELSVFRSSNRWSLMMFPQFLQHLQHQLQLLLPVWQQGAPCCCLVCLWLCGSWNDWSRKLTSLSWAGKIRIHLSCITGSFFSEYFRWIALLIFLFCLFLQQLWHRGASTGLQKQHWQPHIEHSLKL